MYEYGNIEDAKAGDVFECIDDFDTRFTENKLYILKDIRNGSAEVTKCDDGYTEDRYSLSNFKLVKTLPASEAKVGDTVIFTKDSKLGDIKQTIGQLGIVNELSNGIWIYHIDKHEPIGHYCGTQLNEFVVLCKAEPTEKRNLAFYKRSGKPWTDWECVNIVRYVGATYQISNEVWGNAHPTCKYMFDDGTKLMYMANWYNQEEKSNFKNCKQVAYEDVFKTPYLEEASPATPCSQPTPTIPEEETMKENITIAMTADEYAKYKKSNKTAKPKTQLETAPKWFTIWYGVNGNVDCQTTESPKKAKKALQHPSYLVHSHSISLVESNDLLIHEI